MSRERYGGKTECRVSAAHRGYTVASRKRAREETEWHGKDTFRVLKEIKTVPFQYCFIAAEDCDIEQDAGII